MTFEGELYTSLPERVVYATDFSEPAEWALPRVFELAEACGAVVETVHVIPSSTNRSVQSSEDVEWLRAGRARRRMERTRMAYMYDMALRHHAPISHQVLMADDPVEGMQRYLRDGPPSVLVIGRRGETNDPERGLGRVARALLQDATIPTMAVPSVQRGPIRHLTSVIPSEPRPLSLREAPMNLAAALGAKLCILSLREAGADEQRMEQDQGRRADLQQITSAVEDDSEGGDGDEKSVLVPVSLGTNTPGSAAWVETVLREASRVRSDLLIVPRKLKLRYGESDPQFGLRIAAASPLCTLVV